MKLFENYDIRKLISIYQLSVVSSTNITVVPTLYMGATTLTNWM